MSGIPIKIVIDESKPNLLRAMKENPTAAKEVMETFVTMMEHTFTEGWHTLPKQFHPDLTFKSLIHDILHGVLDLKEIDPKYYDDLGVLVHPFGLFSYRPFGDGMKYYDYQRHFDWKNGHDLPVIQSLLRKLLYYARWIEFDKLHDAMKRKDMDLYLIERDPSPLIASHPAIQYQEKNMGQRFAGKLVDKFGVFDCGTLPEGAEYCPACSTGNLIDLPDMKACERCGAGFKTGVSK